MKRIELDGKFFRYRRGKLVEIPPEWVGKTTFRQNINKRRKRKRERHALERTVGRRKAKQWLLEEATVGDWALLQEVS